MYHTAKPFSGKDGMGNAVCRRPVEPGRGHFFPVQEFRYQPVRNFKNGKPGFPCKLRSKGTTGVQNVVRGYGFRLFLGIAGGSERRKKIKPCRILQTERSYRGSPEEGGMGARSGGNGNIARQGSDIGSFGTMYTDVCCGNRSFCGIFSSIRPV